MIQLLKDNWYIAAAGAALLLTAVLLIHRLMEKKKQEKKQYTQRMKDQVLNEALKNNLGRKNVFKKPEQAVPLESSAPYADREKARAGQILLKLTVTKRPVFALEYCMVLQTFEGLKLCRYRQKDAQRILETWWRNEE